MEIPITKEQQANADRAIYAVNSDRARNGQEPIDAATWLAERLGALIDQMASRAEAIKINAVSEAFVKLSPEEQKQVADILKIPPASAVVSAESSDRLI